MSWGGLVTEGEAELVLAEGRFHDLHSVRPLDRAAYGSVWQRLEYIRGRETELCQFFRGLCGKARLPAVRRAVCFLAEA